MSDISADETQSVAATIRSQIEAGVLMSLGFSDPAHGTIEGMPAFIFHARILPFTKSGDRSTRPAVMTVAIGLDYGSDSYTVIVTRTARGEVVEHARVSGVYADQLSPLLLGLDFDGDTVFNPRYWHDS